MRTLFLPWSRGSVPGRASLRPGVATLATLVAIVSARAQPAPIDLIWRGGAYNWTDPARWNPAGVPNDSAGSSYNATIDATGSNVRLTQDIAIQALKWSEGTLSRLGTGRFTLTVNRGLDLSGGSQKTLNTVRLVLGGNSAWTNAGNWSLTGAEVENRGLLELRSDADLVGSGSFLNAAGATLRKQAGTDVARFGVNPGLPATNHGTVDVRSGTVQWLGSAVHHGAFRVAAGSVLLFGSGTHQLDGETPLDLPAGSTLGVRDTSATLWLSAVGPLDLAGRIEVGPSARFLADTPLRVAELAVDSGALEGSGPVEVASLFEWATGALTGLGTLRLGPAAKLILSPQNASRSLSRRTLQFDNAVDWGRVGLTLGADATLLIRSNFTVQAGAVFSASAGQTARVRNEGVVQQIVGSTQPTSQFGLAGGGMILFDNLGRVEVATNTLSLPHGGIHSGPFRVGSKAMLTLGGRAGSIHRFQAGALLELPAPDAILDLRAGEFDFDSGQNVDPLGKLQLSDAHLVVHAGTRLIFGQLQFFGAGGAVELDGGEFGTTGTAVLTGSLAGHGRLEGNFTAPNLLVAPGGSANPAGRILFDGAATFGANSTLALQLGGTAAGTEFDQVEATGAVSLNNARLQLAFVRDFQRTIAASDRFVLLRAGRLQGALANLPNPSTGARLYTEDGYGSFRVDYSATEVVISDYRPDIAPHELEAWEPFDYPVAVPPSPAVTLVAKNGGSGFVGPWLSSSGITTEFQLAADSLPYPSLLRAGQHVALAAPRSGSLVQRPLLYRLGAPGRTQYVSCLVRPLSPVSPTTFFGLLFVRPTPATGTAPVNLFVGKPGGGAGDRFVIEEAGGARQQAASGAPLVGGQTYLLVVKLESAAGPDRVSLFVDPVPGQPEPSTANAVKSDFDVGVIPTIGLNSSGAWEVDELRIGNTWASVTRPADFHTPLAIAAFRDPVVEEGAALDLNPQLVESVAPRTVQWDLPTAPVGMTIDADSGRIRWTPPETEGQPAGTAGVPVVVRVRDFPEPSSAATYAFSISVPERNSAPGFDGASVGVTEIMPGEAYHRDLRALDPDVPQNPVTFTLVEGPPGMTLTPAGGLDWTPPMTQAPGLVHVVVEVEDLNATAIRDPRLRGRGFFDLNVVPRTDLRLALTASPSAPLIAGQRGGYRLEVKNDGPATAQAVEVRFASSVPFVPPATGLTITETSSSQATSPPGIDNDEWVFRLGDLAVGALATVRMEMILSLPQVYTLTWAVRSTTGELRGQDNRVDLGVTVGTPPLDNPESWQFSTVEHEGLTGAEVVMDVDPVEGTPVLAWFNESQHALRFARRRGFDWDIQTVRWFAAGDRIGHRGGLALQVTTSGLRIAFVITPERGPIQIRYVFQPWDLPPVEEIVHQPSHPVGSLQFFGAAAGPPALWFGEGNFLVEAEPNVSSAGGWIATAHPLPDGTILYPSGRPLSVTQSLPTGQRVVHAILQHTDRTLELVGATVPTTDRNRFDRIATMPGTHLPLYLSSVQAGAVTRLAYTFPDPGFVGPDGEAYRLRIAYAEGAPGSWRRDEPLPTPVGVTGSCTRPVVFLDGQGRPGIVFAGTSQTADHPETLLEGDTGREYRRTWHLARLDGASWRQEEIYASGEFAFGFTREQQLARLPYPEDPALDVALDSRGVLMVVAHTGWPTENLVFGSLSPRWRVFQVADLTTASNHGPSLSVGPEAQPFVAWTEIPETGSYELRSAVLPDRSIQFTRGPVVRTPGPGSERSAGVGVDHRLHVLVPDLAAGGPLSEYVLAAGGVEWETTVLPTEARSDFGDAGIVALPDGFATVVFDTDGRPALFTRTVELYRWSGLARNLVSPSGTRPRRVALAGVDEAAAEPALFVAYVPDRPPGSSAPFAVRVATFRDGLWNDEEVTTVSGEQAPLLDAKWLWHPPFESTSLGYLYLAITGAPDEQGRSQVRVFRRDLTRTDSVWENTALEGVPADYSRGLRLDGYRESLRIGYLASGGRLYLARAEFAYNFNEVRRAAVERVPISGLIEEFDLAFRPEGTWFAVTHDQRVEVAAVGPIWSFGGREDLPTRSPAPYPSGGRPKPSGRDECFFSIVPRADESGNDEPSTPSEPGPFAPTGAKLRVHSRAQSGPSLSGLSLLYAVRDLMNRSSEGKRLVDLYYRHEGEARAVLWKNPSTGPSVVFLLANFYPALRDWVEGKGSQATLTPGLIDQLNGVWSSLAALGGAELKGALETERNRFHGFQDFVGKNMDEWATLLAIPSTASASPVRIAATRYTGASVTLVVDASADLAIRLERSPVLTGGTWSTVSNAVEATVDGQRSLTDPTPLPRVAFYRVVAGGGVAPNVR